MYSTGGSRQPKLPQKQHMKLQMYQNKTAKSTTGYYTAPKAMFKSECSLCTRCHETEICAAMDLGDIITATTRTFVLSGL